MILKSRSNLVEPITTFVRANHPYETPEVVSLKIEAGNGAFLDWIADSTAGAGKE